MIDIHIYIIDLSCSLTQFDNMIDDSCSDLIPRPPMGLNFALENPQMPIGRVTVTMARPRELFVQSCPTYFGSPFPSEHVSFHLHTTLFRNTTSPKPQPNTTHKATSFKQKTLKKHRHLSLKKNSKSLAQASFRHPDPIVLASNVAPTPRWWFPNPSHRLPQGGPNRVNLLELLVFFFLGIHMELLLLLYTRKKAG